MTENKNNTSRIIAIVLAVLLIAALGYTFYNKNEHKKLTDAIEEEKAEIAQNLDSMIVKYEDAIGQNTIMSNELAAERDRVISMRDSIKDLKATNYSLIRRYRKQVASLEETNKRLFFLTDSLTTVNESLTMDLTDANEMITNQIAINDTLSMQNLNLSEKVAIGSILKVNTARVLAMRERTSGKLTETSRARNTDAFRVNFTIAKNEISEQGERNVYIQIMDEQGATIASKGTLNFPDETMIAYSDATTVNYLNEPIDVISLVEVDRESIEKGRYIVQIFIEDKIAGATQIVLK